MSRLIIKNLPNNVSSDKLKEKFSEFGRVTDIQLKYTPEGKFRKFGFIGFETAEEAANAIQNLNKTFYGASRIEVQECAELGDAKKPKSWSKYAADSTAFQNLHGKKIDSIVADLSKDEKKKKKKDKKKPLNSELILSLKKFLDHPHFLDFLELRGKKDFVLKMIQEFDSQKELEENAGEEEKAKPEESREKEDKENKSIAFSSLTDAEYLKMKMKGNEEEKKAIMTAPAVKEGDKEHYFTVKISNLPYKAKKKEVKELLLPLAPASVRLINHAKGVAYVGFKTEKEMRQALVKNKTFLSGKQILINEVKDKTAFEKPDKWKRQEEALKNEECIAESGRIFIRNLPYSVREDEIEKLFSEFGPVTEVILPIDKIARQIRGYAVVTFLMPEHAVAAYCKLDGTIFHGRMLHLLPGKAKEETEENPDESYKTKKAKKLKATAGSSHNWNTLFLDLNAVADVIAEKYNCSREDVLTGTDAAVRLALGETQVVNETKQFLEENGVILDAFNQGTSSPRSKTVILVKNLPAKTTTVEIRDIFAKFGQLGRVLLPPSGVTGIVEFLEQSEAKAAFKKLAYSKFKNSPLYLEWAPENSLNAVQPKELNENNSNQETVHKKEPKRSPDEEIDPEPDTTLFVKNLSFYTTDDALKQLFEPCGKIAKVQVAAKKDPKNPGQVISMGYGFVQFYRQSAVNDALKKLQGAQIDGRAIELKRSNKTLVTEVECNRKSTNMEEQTGAKIIVRNIPFQATAKEIEKLFSTFGELKFVRLPKKLVGTGPHRGFGFVEFLSKHDAKRAMTALGQSTHLFGRRLVLEWAKLDEGVEELRKRTAQHFNSDAPLQKKSNKAVFSMNDEQPEEEMMED